MLCWITPKKNNVNVISVILCYAELHTILHRSMTIHVIHVVSIFLYTDALWYIIYTHLYRIHCCTCIITHAMLFFIHCKNDKKKEILLLFQCFSLFISTNIFLFILLLIIKLYFIVPWLNVPSLNVVLKKSLHIGADCFLFTQ